MTSFSAISSKTLKKLKIKNIFKVLHDLAGPGLHLQGHHYLPWEITSLQLLHTKPSVGQVLMLWVSFTSLYTPQLACLWAFKHAIPSGLSSPQQWGAFAWLTLDACVHAKSLQPTLCNSMDRSPPGSSVHGILQQEYWSGLPCPSPGDLPVPGIKLVSLVSCIGRQILHHQPYCPIFKMGVIFISKAFQISPVCRMCTSHGFPLHRRLR